MQRVAVSLALASLLAFLPAVDANHVQTDSGNPIVFRSQGGNEWWVQVQISGEGAGTVATMEAADYAGPWVQMTKHYGWGFGVWAASFHIEPTHPVKFRATWPGGAQQESCWFSHPQGVEGCTVPPPPPPPAFTTTLVGDAGRSHGGTDLSIGRVRGMNEVFVPAPTGLYAFTWTSSGWTRSLVASGNFDHVAVGDLEGDGHADVVASTYDFSNDHATVFRFSWDGTQWLGLPLFALTGSEVTGLSFANLDESGQPELYVITGHPRTSHNGLGYDVYQVTWTGSTSVSSRIATNPNPHEFPGGLGSLWAGDADNDGDQELVVGSGESGDPRVFLLDVAAGGGWTLDLAGIAGDDQLSAVVVGDPDHDGRNEVYATALPSAFQDELWQFRKTAAGWTGQRIVLFASGTLINDLFYADGDSDGKAELYATAGNGHVFQIVWTGTQWSPRDIADVQGMGGTDDWLDDIVVGDGDNDGRNEVYADGFDFSTCCPAHHVFRIGTVQPPPPPPPGFDATFTSVRGNEWWVQANVATSGGTLSKVDVSLNGGAWMPLAKQSWGGWAASYHITQGTIVQLRATSSTGATDLSSCRQWIPPPNTDATIVQCGSAPPPPPPGFDATFSGVKGNEWWVQANVAANQPLAGVDARVNCGTWVPLTLQSWGGWAKSFHVPNGAKVDFRARSTGGATDLSGGYIWPNATPTSAC
ncbi:MAG: hypothetical protein LC623_02430 [Halobacteriales archaeon]|nr:hypothetical protein [Halobacteriales archaeon]